MDSDDVLASELIVNNMDHLVSLCHLLFARIKEGKMADWMRLLPDNDLMCLGALAIHAINNHMRDKIENEMQQRN